MAGRPPINNPMRAALMRCGLNRATADYMIGDQGFDTVEELLMASKDSFDSMIKNAIRAAPAGVSFASSSVRRLAAFKFWAEERYMCGLPTLPQLFTLDVMGEYLLLLRADEIESAAKAGQIPTKPDPLKTEKEWFKFWEKLKNYLGRIRGAARLPLLYVVRDHDEVTDDIREREYDSHTRQICSIVLLSGQHYEVDNESVWEIVKSLVIDGFGWSFVKRFDRKMDGRSAIQALRRQCEGKTSIKTRKNKAYGSIGSAVYKGIRKQFTFAQYVSIHQAAHNELEDCGEPIPETKKVSDFLAGISDSSLEPGITCVLSEDRYSDSFEATQQFLGTLVANQMIHRQGKRGTGDDRNVSMSEAGDKKNAGKGSNKAKKKLEARFYAREEWNKLTKEERNKVIELKKAKNKNKDKVSNKRNASAVAKESEDVQSDSEDPEDTESGDQAGNEF